MQRVFFSVLARYALSLLAGLVVSSWALARPIARVLPSAKDQEEVAERTYVWQPGDTLSIVLYREGLGRPGNSPRIYGPKGWMRRNELANPRVKDWERLAPGTTITLVLPKAFAAPRNVDGDHRPVKAAPIVKQASKSLVTLARDAPYGALPRGPKEANQAAADPKPRNAESRAIREDEAETMIPKPSEGKLAQVKRQEASKDPSLRLLARPHKGPESKKKHLSSEHSSFLLVLLASVLVGFAGGAGGMWLRSRAQEARQKTRGNDWVVWLDHLEELLKCADFELQAGLNVVRRLGLPAPSIAHFFTMPLADPSAATRRRAAFIYTRLGIADADLAQLRSQRAEDRVQAAERLSALGDQRLTVAVLAAFADEERVSASDLETVFANIARADPSGFAAGSLKLRSKPGVRAAIRAHGRFAARGAEEHIEILAQKFGDDSDVNHDARLAAKAILRRR